MRIYTEAASVAVTVASLVDGDRVRALGQAQLMTYRYGIDPRTPLSKATHLLLGDGEEYPWHYDGRQVVLRVIPIMASEATQ